MGEGAREGEREREGGGGNHIARSVTLECPLQLEKSSK